MLKINIKKILQLPIILLFFSALAVWVPFTNGTYLVFYILLDIILICLLLKDNKRFIKNIIFFIKTTPLKYFTLALGLIFFNSIFVSLLGISSLKTTIFSYTITIILYIVSVMIYFIYILRYYVSYKTFVKFFLLLFWLNLILGFVSYTGAYFNIDIINNLFDMLANQRIISWENLGYNREMSNYFAFGLPRLDNLCAEPAHYAQFLYIFLPFVYAFSLSDYKLCENKYLNILIKKTLIPFTWLSIILTASPIFLILSSIITFIYFYKSIIKQFKKYFIVISVLLCSVIIFLHTAELTDTYLSRIINVVTQVHSFDDFILIEPSLATRITEYINAICIFFKHPLFGVGIGNIPNIMLHQLQNSPVSLTPETINNVKFASLTNSKLIVHCSYITQICAESGIFVFCFIVYFYYRLFTQISFLLKQKLISGFDKILLISLRYSFIALFIISIYNLAFICKEIYILTALTIVLILNLKKKIYINNLKNSVREINETNILLES